jgi:alpha-galactosidase
MISRREFLAIGAGAAARLKARATGEHAASRGDASRDMASQDVARGFSRASGVEIEREYDGVFCRLRIVNRGKTPVRLDDIVVLDQPIVFPATETALYGEGFQMLSQTGGTMAAPVDYSQYTDAKHYRIPVADGRPSYYGMLTLTPFDGKTQVYAFTSCVRFSGRFQIRDSAVQAIVDGEGLTIEPGRSWPIEELMVASGSDRSALLNQVAARLARNHRVGRSFQGVARPFQGRDRGPQRPAPQRSSTPPTGWCSWYCFGPNVTAQQVLDNLDVVAKSFPSLKYIQIDDGYQPAMGDWLETGAAFGGSVRTVLAEIRRRGFQPAIWVAPFIAEERSHLFQQHPDWFIKDDRGQPLRSDRVTFGGWRRGPWYAIDGTHPGAQAHLARVFRTMRREWGCTYFKLDANFWGAMHGGRFHDRGATRIDAYRRGMQAIGRGAGDGFLLGCNHPIWPSIGVIHGSRSSNDIKRSWDRVASTARQNLSRNWQNGRLWWNDPDAVVLAGELADAECQFHATAIYATGGMVLSGDDLTKIPEARAAMLRKLLPPTGIAAEFTDATLTVGVVNVPNARMICLFNWDDRGDTVTFDVPQPSTITDYWTDQSLGRREGTVAIELPPRSARLLKVV